MFKDNKFIIDNQLNYNVIKSLMTKNKLNININNNLYTKIKKFNNLDSKEIKIIEATADGNYFYNSLSKFLFSTEDYNTLSRQTLYNYIYNKKF